MRTIDYQHDVLYAQGEGDRLAGWQVTPTNSFTLGAYTTGAYACDAAGCVTHIAYSSASSASSARTLSWDAEYRLAGVTTNGIPAESYGYDPLGRRMSRPDFGLTLSGGC